MIDLLFRGDAEPAAEIVGRALERSFTRGQVRIGGDRWPQPAPGAIVVALAPSEDDAERLTTLARSGSKILLLGPLGPKLADLAGICLSPIEDAFADAAACPPAATYGLSQSAGAVRYADRSLGAASPLRERRLCRFDFTNEWNNLGFGRIGIGDDLWSIAVTARPTAAELVAELAVAGHSVGAVATLRDTPTASILWFARPVGPLDGADWRVVETFLSDHRPAELPCRPHLRDIPHGVAAAVTMRLDCDEDIASARPLYDLYRSRGLPLSVAIKTDQPETPEHLAFLSDLHAAGGTILSHSVSHAPNWGGSGEAAENEARASKAWLESRVPGLTVRYAVSPFHQNPTYVPAALARAGYDGFVGGIIANDPEYLMARGGRVPYGPSGFISHSQACMLHGDCLLADGDPIRIYKEAFRIARAGGQFFGYLDHPFSLRYAYGWASEEDRLSKHTEFLDFIAAECATAGPLLFLNEETCLDFMLGKAATEIAYDRTRGSYQVSRTHAAGMPLSVGFRGVIGSVSDA
ncbi:MAG: hypothetical protein HXX10_14540 [Rhodoplanes sp.]|uniref:hypothetical protein n=1 Tax=Rhodoplanes sp. TaxID=1968906 RepID=UPI001797FDDE|nr:hypothetical protein [Rhodoplanes sp.]NVO15250.1 hypothetical protein [Rhodoplanes sp.]